MTCHPGECSYRRADWACQLIVGRMLVINSPPASRAFKVLVGPMSARQSRKEGR